MRQVLETRETFVNRTLREKGLGSGIRRNRTVPKYKPRQPSKYELEAERKRQEHWDREARRIVERMLRDRNLPYELEAELKRQEKWDKEARRIVERTLR